MTDVVIPSPYRQHRSKVEAIRPRLAVGDWIVPAGDREVELPGENLGSGPLGGFEVVDQADDGTSVTVDGGEAFIAGRYVARDTETTVSLSESPSDGDRIGLAFDLGTDDSITIDEYATLQETAKSGATSEPLAIVEYVTLVQPTRLSGTSTSSGWVTTGPREPTPDRFAPQSHGSSHAPDSDDPITGYAKGSVGITTGRATVTVTGGGSALVQVTFDRSLDNAPKSVQATPRTNGIGDQIDIETPVATADYAQVRIWNGDSSDHDVQVDVLAAG